MKPLRIVLVFALLGLARPPAFPTSRALAPATTPVARRIGKGIWDELACAGCIGSYVGLSAMGWGALAPLVFTMGDGACVDVCISAFG